ncbi:unnamed protein product [Schistosoma haematobium]|nr:unnamed protein product [Schistosoma haematobium]
MASQYDQFIWVFPATIYFILITYDTLPIFQSAFYIVQSTEYTQLHNQMKVHCNKEKKENDIVTFIWFT